MASDAPVPPGQGIPVVLESFDGGSAAGTMDVRRMGVGGRARRAARALAICWLVAIGAVAVPILHWILVPALVLLGPVLALRAFGTEREVCGGGGACPSCGAAIAFRRATSPEGFSQACGACRMTLHVRPARPAA